MGGAVHASDYQLTLGGEGFAKQDTEGECIGFFADTFHSDLDFYLVVEGEGGQVVGFDVDTRQQDLTVLDVIVGEA